MISDGLKITSTVRSYNIRGVTGCGFQGTIPGNANGTLGEKFLKGYRGNLEAQRLEDFLEMLWKIF